MRLSILQGDLKEMLGKVKTVIPTRPIRDILECIKVDATEDGLDITASSQDQTFISSTKATIHEQGKFCVPIKTFGAFIDSIAAHQFIDLSFSKDEKTLIAKANGMTSRFNLMPYDDFPLAQLPSKVDFTIPEGMFQKLVKHTGFAAAPDKDHREVLKCINMYSKDGKLVSVASNGFTVVRMELDCEIPDGVSLLIKATDFAAISRVLTKEVNVRIEKGRAVFWDQSMVCMNQMIQGAYPNVENFFGVEIKGDPLVINTTTKDWLTQVRAASVFAEHTLKIWTKNSVLRISSSGDNGDFVGPVLATVSGADTAIAVDKERFFELLSGFPEDCITFQIEGPNAMYRAWNESQAWRAIAMPLLVSADQLRELHTGEDEQPTFDSIPHAAETLRERISSSSPYEPEDDIPPISSYVPEDEDDLPFN